MWQIVFRLVFLSAAFTISVSPLDAREGPRERAEKREPADLRRDVERISREIYPARSAPPERGSLAAGRAPKKR